MIDTMTAFSTSMTGILFLVAWRLIDFHHISSIMKTSRSETVILWVTLIGTLIDLEKGIFIGIILSLMTFLYRTSRPAISAVVPDPEPDSYHCIPATDRLECPQVKMVRVNGSIFFGAMNHVQQNLLEIDEINPDAKHVASGINFIDIAGAEMLTQEAKRRRKMGGGLYFYRVKEKVCQLIRKGHYIDDIGEANIIEAKTHPIASIYPKLNAEICRNCETRIFNECKVTLPNGEPRV